MTNNDHFLGGLSRWNGPNGTKAIIFAGENDKKGTTERLQGSEWVKDSAKKTDKHFENLYFLTSASYKNQVYAFGGEYASGHSGFSSAGGPSGHNGATKKVYMYDGKWHKDIDMSVPRRGHSSLVVDNRIVHIGGQSDHSFEIWTDMGKGAWKIKNSKITLKNWYKNANSFIIGPSDYE